MADAWRALADEIAGGAQEEFVRELTERMGGILDEAVESGEAPSREEVERELMAVWAGAADGVTGDAESAFCDAMEAEDGAIAAALSALAVAPLARGSSPAAGRVDVMPSDRLRVAAQQVAQIVLRQNVALVQTAAERWFDAVAAAVIGEESGVGRQAAMELACEELARAGLETVDYSSGRRTTIDAAIRRHVITQQSQCRAELLEERMREWGHDLVYTSAHWAPRPTHRPWQGKVFSLFGETPGYATLADGTGYGTPGGLCGCNCRHRFYPYVPGRSKLPSTDFSAQERRFGMSSDERYAATQRQRDMEREIRATKREVALGQSRGLDMAAARYRLGRQQARLAAHVKSCGLTRDYSRERAYGVGGQPRALKLSLKENRAREDARNYKVNERTVNSKGYASMVRRALGTCGDVAVEDARRMLRHRRGTAYEDLYAYDLTAGKRLDSVTGQKVRKTVTPTKRMRSRIEKAVSDGHDVATMHNHPGSSIPSASDIRALRATGAKRGVIACHDGTLYTYELVGDPAPGYTLDDKSLRLAYELRSSDGAKAFEAIERLFGVRIEHLT